MPKMPKHARLVNFKPNPTMTQRNIEYLNDQTTKLDAQQLADMISSSVAAGAFMMMGQNSADNVRTMFAACVDDAIKQYEYRKKLIASKANGANGN